MDKILHPVSGEDGYFCTETEKILIDAILHDYSMNQLVLTSATGRGEEHDQSRFHWSIDPVLEH